MIKLEHVVLPSPEQMEFVIEGMRNPMNSWDKSDTCVRICRTGFHEDRPCDPECANPNCYGPYINKEIGPNDLSLMQKLSNNGPVHSKFMRMMPVMVRITAPLYWWKEFDTYKVGTVANSCSTMHKITEKEFTLEDFSTEHLESFYTAERPYFLNDYLVFDSWDSFKYIINNLNASRKNYLMLKAQLKEENDPERKQIISEWMKRYWWQMIQLLPSSYNQTRNVMLDYEVLKNIYIWRKNHKLDEWVEFCKWIETLPYAELITGGEIKQ